MTPPTARRSSTNFAYVHPTAFPPLSKSHGSYHWSFERRLAPGLVSLTTAAFVASSSPAPLLDGLCSVSVILNVATFDLVWVDYVHKRKFPALGPLLTLMPHPTTLACTSLTKLIRRIWTG
ncbi:mitochondrial inner membrane protein [Lactarius tabidus]